MTYSCAVHRALVAVAAFAFVATIAAQAPQGQGRRSQAQDTGGRSATYDPLKTFAPYTMPLPTTSYRGGDGAPTPTYWQNSADYEMHASIVNLNDAEALEAQLVENLIRVDVHSMEEAQGFKALLDFEEPTYSIEQIAAKTGKSPAFVAARLKLIDLVPSAVEAFYRDEIGVGHALLLAKLPAKQQEQALSACFREDWSGSVSIAPGGPDITSSCFPISQAGCLHRPKLLSGESGGLCCQADRRGAGAC
ncbi:MAG: hypothetical protein ABSA39_08485 [Edaphobacter sp.]